MKNMETESCDSSSPNKCYISRSGRKVTPKKPFYDDSNSEKDTGSPEKVIKCKKEKCVGNLLKSNEDSSKRKNIKDCFSPKSGNKSDGLSEKNRDSTNVTKTPYSFRQRLKNKIQNEVDKDEEAPFEVSEESEWDESDETETEGSDESEKEELAKPIHLLSKSSSLNLKTSLRKCRYVCSSSDYLEKSYGKSIVSSEKLKRIEDVELISKLLSSYRPSHSSNISLLGDHNQNQFYKWMYTLSNGYNVLTYGLGSKKYLLDQFRLTCLDMCSSLVINGYYPGLTIKELISSLFELIGGKSKETMENLFSLLDQLNIHIFIIIHNIDGPALRQGKIQTLLSQLASREKVHLIASIDHINAPLLWDQKKLCLFNFIWEDCSSYLPYNNEMSYENSLMARSSTALALSSLRNVYKSLNQNSRNIFKILLEHSLNSKNKNIGLKFSELYRLCRRNFIVSSDLALRTQLTEFIDHQLIRWRKDTDMLTVCVEIAVLKTFKIEIDSNNL